MLNAPPIPIPDPATGITPLQSIRDAARLLNVSTKTVVRLANAGKLQATRIG